MIIHVFNRQKDLKIDKSSARALVESTLEFQNSHPEEVSIYFVTKKKIQELHEEFFDDPTPTDCISFPIDKTYLGEVFVCPRVAIEYAEKKNLCMYDETALYVIHGLLHLLGFDDMEEKKRRTMRKNEKSCMDNLNRKKISLKPA